MEFRIGCSVTDRDGDRVGKLKHVIVNPDSKEVEEIVLSETGLLGRELVTPIGVVGSAEADEVKLDLDKTQIEGLKDFVQTRYLEPPAGGFEGMPWAGGALISPGIAPVGAAAGIESIAYTPIVESREQIQEGDIDIAPGTEVWATDGKVGTVADVSVDDQTKRVTSFTIQEGVLFHHEVEVPISQVSSIGEDRIDLNVAKDELSE